MARDDAMDQLTRERLSQVTADVIMTITSPVFVEKMRRARAAADKDKGLEQAVSLLSIEGLREAGANIPADFRLTSRVFEDRQQGVRLELNEAPRPGDVAPAWGVCGGAGGLTFCGCGGFQQ